MTPCAASIGFGPISDTELKKTEVDLSGLLEVLGKNLYSTPTVAIRELVQNAHDSVVRRSIEAPGGEPSIAVFSRPEARILIFEDRGAGLTKDEIERYLATVGAGYTRRIRVEDRRLIGQFGLGFLTAFIVSDRVDVFTTSYQSPGEGWHFSSKTGERYALRPTAPRAIGMRVELLLSSRFASLADRSRLRELLEHYCALLPVPVFADEEEEEPINPEPPPWRRPGLSELRRRKLCLELAQRFEPTFEPLCTIDLGDGPAKGLLWIQDGATFSTSDNRNVRVFVRGMLVSQDERDLLPKWGGFVGGVIESDELSPTASREDLQKDEAYLAVADQLQRALVSGLERIASEDQEIWRRILRRHNEALLGAGLCDASLFALLADELDVPTSEGDLRMPALADRSGGKIYISIGERGSFEETLFRALSVPVVIGFRYAALPFATRWGEARGRPVVRLGTTEGNEALFAKATISEEDVALLEDLLLDDGQELVPSRFEPENLPLVLMPDRDAELKARIDADEADRRIGSALLGLARLYTKEVDGDVKARLYVNVGSPMIRALLASSKPERRSAAADLLKALAQLMGSHKEGRGPDLSETLVLFSASVLSLLE